MYTTLVIVVIFAWFKFHPAIEISREKDVLLFYDSIDGRDYIKLFRL